MHYTSSNGCLFYYDRILYAWRLCEPTMLFLLGFEAITLGSQAQSDKITLSKYAYQSDSDTLVELTDFDIYDDIYNYLSNYGSVSDTVSNIQYNCYGLKLLMNELTGTDTDRTIPIIFKNDTNASKIDLTDNMYRVEDVTSKSVYDLQAQKIHDIFTDAGYTKSGAISYNSKNQISINSKFYTLHDSDKDTIDTYNTNLDERAENSSIYMYLDYKAMYSYALGVLYGCRCLGYNNNTIWRYDPTYWYNGEYVNLVKTAWYVFNFHFTNALHNDDSALKELYTGLQVNKLWNFTNDDDSDVILKEDEKLSYIASVDTDNDAINLDAIIYSESTEDSTTYTTNYPGCYYDIDSKTWKSINNKINDTTKEGMFTDDTEAIVRYIGPNPVYIYKSYEYDADNDDTTDNNSYISPAGKNYFIATGNFGWADFDENDWKNRYLYDPVESSETTDTSTESYSTLSIGPIALSELPLYSLGIKRAYNQETHAIVSYYICNTKYETSTSTTDNCLFGIFDGICVTTADSYTLPDSDSDTFVEVLSKTSFAKKYTDINDDEDIPLSSAIYYYINKPYTLYVSDEEPAQWYDKLYWTGEISDQTDPYVTKEIKTIGYTPTPATSFIGYLYDDTSTTNPVSANIIYYNAENLYWSRQWIDENDTDSEYWIDKSTYENKFIYTVNNNYNISLYKGTDELVTDNLLYYVYNNIPIEYDANAEYTNGYYKLPDDTIIAKVDAIFNDNKSYYYVYNNDESITDIGFKSLDYLYTNYGITTYSCEIIETDDNGNSLLDDDGNPLVWYDSVYNKYWNGLNNVNQWVDSKPVLTTTLAYNAATNTTFTVSDDLTNQTVTVDGVTYTYAEFYNLPDYIEVLETSLVSTTETHTTYKLKISDDQLTVDSGNSDYTLYDDEYNQITIDDCMLTFGCDADGSYIFIAISADTSSDINTVKYIAITTNN